MLVPSTLNSTFILLVIKSPPKPWQSYSFPTKITSSTSSPNQLDHLISLTCVPSPTLSAPRLACKGLLNNLMFNKEIQIYTMHMETQAFATLFPKVNRN